MACGSLVRTAIQLSRHDEEHSRRNGETIDTNYRRGESGRRNECAGMLHADEDAHREETLKLHAIWAAEEVKNTTTVAAPRCSGC